MTDQDRAQEIRDRCEKATTGPWCWESTGEKSNDYSIGTALGPNDEPISGRILTTDDPEYAAENDILVDEHILRRHLVGDGENGNFADADFIAHARSDIPWLLDQLRAAQQSRDKAWAAFREADATIDGMLKAAEEASPSAARQDARIWKASAEKFAQQLAVEHAKVDELQAQLGDPMKQRYAAAWKQSADNFAQRLVVLAADLQEARMDKLPSTKFIAQELAAIQRVLAAQAKRLAAISK